MHVLQIERTIFIFLFFRSITSHEEWIDGFLQWITCISDGTKSLTSVSEWLLFLSLLMFIFCLVLLSAARVEVPWISFSPHVSRDEIDANSITRMLVISSDHSYGFCSTGPIPRFWNFHRILKPLEFTHKFPLKDVYKYPAFPLIRILESLEFSNYQNFRIIRIIRTCELSEFNNNQNN